MSFCTFPPHHFNFPVQNTGLAHRSGHLSEESVVTGDFPPISGTYRVFYRAKMQHFRSLSTFIELCLLTLARCKAQYSGSDHNNNVLRERLHNTTATASQSLHISFARGQLSVPFVVSVW